MTGVDEAVQIEIPQCAAGTGKLIMSADSPDLISGVGISTLSVFPDDRGYFLEIARLGVGAAAAFPKESTQVSGALSYPGTIKAFHFHRHQTDLWAPAQGMFQVALVDMRPNSPTYGLKN